MNDKATWVGRTIVYSLPYIGICVTKKQLRREMKRLKVTEEVVWCSNRGARVNFLESKIDDNKVCLVCINKNYKGYTTQEVQGLLVHESVHIWQTILEEMGEDSPGREIEAYAIQQIYINLSDAYEKMTQRKKK